MEHFERQPETAKRKRDSVAAPKRGKRKPQRLPGALNVDERELLLDQPSRRYPTSIRNRVMMATMLKAGLRCNELVTLKPGDVDLKARTIRVIGKGNKQRVIPISGTLLPELREWRTLRKPGATFFNTLKGTTVHASYVRRMVKRYALKAGIERDVHPHLLRHTCASSWLNDEPRMSIKEVQFLMGHSRLSTTEKYLHANPVEIQGKLDQR